MHVNACMHVCVCGVGDGQEDVSMSEFRVTFDGVCWLECILLCVYV